MYVLYVIVNVVLMVLCINCDINLRDNEYSLLPSIFHIDNYEKCKAAGKLFCKVSVELIPRGAEITSTYWKIIEKSLNDKRAYNHNELFHAICADDFCPNQEFTQVDQYEKILSNCYTQKYEHLGLAANITNFNCSNHDHVYKAGIVDIIWILLLLTYVFYIILASIWDYFQIQSGGHTKQLSNFEKVYILPFSVVTNWAKLRKSNDSLEFQNLKCIQGIRFYNMLLIIFCHTYSSYIGGYVLNTAYIEDIPNNPLRLGIRNLLVFLVQTFFLFSAFLLSYHIFQIIDSAKKFNKRTILLTFLNRYLRIIPPVLIMIGLGSTIWIVIFFYGPIKDLYSDLEYQRCQKNWWTTLLFINNHYNQHDMCYFITWYLAADTQLYVVSLIILSLIWKYKHRTKLILMISVIIGILIPTAISYIYDLDVIYRITPENSKNNKFRSFNFNAIYSSTYANLATYMVGICIGYIYFQKKNHDIFNNLLHKSLWWAAFIGLPTLVITTSSFYYSRFYSAMLCGILKPLYALGIGIGILGMSRKIGGSVKSVCEWRPAIFMGNFTYSTYVVHYGIVFYRTATANEPLYMSDFVLIKSFLYDAVFSFLCGFLMYIMVEMPALQLQKMLIPQVRRQHNVSSDSKNK